MGNGQDTDCGQAPRRERRRFLRQRFGATAGLWRQGSCAGEFELLEMSMGGCRLLQTPGASSDKKKASGEFDLRIRVSSSGPVLSIPAFVVRHDALGLGLRFADLPVTTRERLFTALNAETPARRPSLVRGAHPTGMVVEPRREQRALIVDGLRSIGHGVVGVATPLDAIQWLLSAEVEPELAVIGEGLASFVIHGDVM